MDNKTCPHCGYCPTCGRASGSWGGYWPWYSPWWQQAPYWPINGTITYTSYMDTAYPKSNTGTK